VLLANGALTAFEGDLEDYAAWLGANRGAAPAAATAAPVASRREQRRLEAEARNRLTPLRGEQQRLEAQLSALAGERLRIEAALSDPGTYTATAAPEQQRLFRRHGELSDEIVQLEARWLEVMTALEERVS